MTTADAGQEHDTSGPSGGSAVRGALVVPSSRIDAAVASVAGWVEERPLPRGSRREEIISNAAEMFAEHGYNGSSVRAIADRVGISHPGMLHHFSTKDALLDAVIDRMEAYAQGALDRIDELSADPDALMRGLVQVWHPASHAIQLMATLDAEVVSEDHPGRFRMARLHRVHEHVIEQCFIALEQRGQLQEDIDPAFASRAILALALNHAAREKTVRTMQSDSHDDSPVRDLVKLAGSFLKPAGGRDRP